MTSERAYTSTRRPPSSTTGNAPHPGISRNASATVELGVIALIGSSAGTGDAAAAAAICEDGSRPSTPAAGLPPPPGCLCEPRNPPSDAVHVPMGRAPMGCENSGSADGTPLKCRTRHASTSARFVRCSSCGTPACGPAPIVPAPPLASPKFPSFDCVGVADGVAPRGTCGP